MKLPDNIEQNRARITKSFQQFSFSKKTLEFHLRLRVSGNMKDNFSFGKGLFLFYASKQNDKSEKYGVIKVYDVKSRKCFREMRITAKSNLETFDHQVGFNSKFMVVAHRKDYGPLSKLNIYDLDLIKNPKSTEDELLVHTLAVQFSFDKILMDETAIICEGKSKFRILDFDFLEYFRNEAKSVILSLPWRSVWRMKGVEEEPLEPVHHMEVYREVLEYYHELSANCQKVIDTYPVDPDVDTDGSTASFALGDEFISYRQLKALDIYDEEWSEESQKINNKSIQIIITDPLFFHNVHQRLQMIRDDQMSIRFGLAIGGRLDFRRARRHSRRSGSTGGSIYC